MLISAGAARADHRVEDEGPLEDVVRETIVRVLETAREKIDESTGTGSDPGRDHRPGREETDRRDRHDDWRWRLEQLHAGHRHRVAALEHRLNHDVHDAEAEFREELAEHDVVAAAAELERPFLVVEAGADTVVGSEQTTRLAEAGGAERVTIPDADHLFSGPVAGGALADAVLDWLDRT